LIVSEHTTAQPVSWPTSDQVMAHKAAGARVVRIEDELLEAVGQGWSTPPPQNQAEIDRLRAGLAAAYEARSRTQAEVFPGVSAER
jgi:hypothetical protein